MSGRLKSPAITTLGVFLCDLYSFVRDAARFDACWVVYHIFCNPNSLIISSSLMCLLAVLVFVVCWLSQSMSGRLKSPAITTLGVFLCDLYSFVRDA